MTNWLGAHYKDVADFRSRYLSTITPQAGQWVRGATVHNTYIPNRGQWMGQSSMNAIWHFYQTTHRWDRGPHLFIAARTPNARNDGIWVGTQLDRVGIHAGPCNSSRLGLEFVIDAQAERWPEDLLDLAGELLAALAKHFNFKEDDVNQHNICMPGRTCPGRYTSLPSIQRRMTYYMNNQVTTDWDRWGTLFPLPPEQRHFGIPQAWLKSLRAGKDLGRAVSLATYDITGSGDAVQMFENGFVFYLDGNAIVRTNGELS